MAGSWQNNKTLLYAWLLMVFPVGLYALWSGNIYNRQKKWLIGLAVVVFFIATSGATFNALLAFVLAPAAVVLVWKDKTLKQATLIKFALGAVVIFFLYIASPEPASIQHSQGGCTYFRDSNFNVFARSCD